MPPRLTESGAGSAFPAYARSSFFGSMTSKIWERRRSACSTSSAIARSAGDPGLDQYISITAIGYLLCLAVDHAEVVLGMARELRSSAKRYTMNRIRFIDLL